MLSENPIRWIDPRPWPWVVYILVAFLLVGWAKPAWRWFRRKRSASWPSTQARIESAGARQPKRSFAGRSPQYVAELEYTYSVEGNSYAGLYETEFGSKPETEEFIRDLRGKSVAVHYNPNKPSSSVLSELDLKVVQETRPPSPAVETIMTLAEAVPLWLKPFLWILVALAALGLAVSLWVHLGAVMGRRVVPAPYFWGLHIGAFVVWFPSIILARRVAKKADRRNFWKVVLKGSPEWMRYMVYGFLGYGVVNFLLFVPLAPDDAFGANPPAVVWRGFSGSCIAFYSAALAILCSGARVGDRGWRG